MEGGKDGRLEGGEDWKIGRREDWVKFLFRVEFKLVSIEKIQEVTLSEKLNGKAPRGSDPLDLPIQRERPRPWPQREWMETWRAVVLVKM